MDFDFYMDIIPMIAIKYIIFAIVSTIFNLLCQYVSFYFYNGKYSLYFAMFNGTIVGLVIKYILDKNYIFYYKANSKMDDGVKFVLYSLMGVFTTLIFWGFEIMFDYCWNLKYIGAIIGLGIGYFTKYQLDKKFVFKE